MATYYPQLLESRILNDSRVDQSGGANGDVTNWTKTNKIILATQIGYDGKDTAASAYKLQWRDETDSPGGAFSDVASTGEVKWSATSSSLSDGTAVTTTTRRCTDQSASMFWQNGLESLADNVCPDAGTLDLGSDYFSELQWGLDLSDSQDGHQYTFQLYNNTEGAATGVCGAQITILAATANYNHTMSGGAVAGGATPVLRGIMFAETGGAVAGGSSEVLRGIVFPETGGAVAGGITDTNFGIVHVSSGGAVAGGITPKTFNPPFESTGLGFHGGIDTIAVLTFGVFTKNFGAAEPGTIANLYASRGLFEDAPNIAIKIINIVMSYFRRRVNA